MTLDDPFALAREPVPDAEFDPSAEFPRTADAIEKLALAIVRAGSPSLADLVARYGTSYTEPDDIWFAEWNDSRSTTTEMSCLSCFLSLGGSVNGWTWPSTSTRE